MEQKKGKLSVQSVLLTCLVTLTLSVTALAADDELARPLEDVFVNVAVSDDTNDGAVEAVSHDAIISALDELENEQTVNPNAIKKPYLVIAVQEDFENLASVTLPYESLVAVQSAEFEPILQISFAENLSIVFGNGALSAIVNEGSGDFTVSAEFATAEQMGLDTEDDFTFCEFVLTLGEKTITDLGENGWINVVVPYTLGDGNNPVQVIGGSVEEDGSTKSQIGYFNEEMSRFTFVTRQLYTFIVGYVPFEVDDMDAASEINDAVRFCAARGFLNELDFDDSFEPDKVVTRSEFISVILRAFNVPVADESLDAQTFADVNADSVYADDVLTARQLGFISGTSENTFSPDMAMTRNMFYKVLHNMYIELNMVSNGDAGKTVNDFEDASLVASWAVDSVNFLLQNGYIDPADQTTLQPEASITRADLCEAIFQLLQ